MALSFRLPRNPAQPFVTSSWNPRLHAGPRDEVSQGQGTPLSSRLLINRPQTMSGFAKPLEICTAARYDASHSAHRRPHWRMIQGFHTIVVNHHDYRNGPNRRMLAVQLLNSGKHPNNVDISACMTSLNLYISCLSPPPIPIPPPHCLSPSVINQKISLTPTVDSTVKAGHFQE